MIDDLFAQFEGAFADSTIKSYRSDFAHFSHWCEKNGIDAANVSQEGLAQFVEHMAAGSSGATIRRHVALAGRGKRGGARTLLVYRVDDKAFFVYGFAKNTRANIKAEELNGLKKLAKELLGYSDRQLELAIGNGALIEVKDDEESNPRCGT